MSEHWVTGGLMAVICADKLSIPSSEWARFGVPLGLMLMIAVFVTLLLV